MLVDISHLKALIETGYLFDFTRLITICINILTELDITCYYSEDLTVEFIVPRSVTLDTQKIETLNVISHMCSIECCLSPLSVSRQMKTFENGKITYGVAKSTKYFLKISKLFSNYPVRQNKFSFLTLSSELKLVFRVVQFISGHLKFDLIHKNTQVYAKDTLTIIESFEINVGVVHHIKVDKLNKKNVGFAKIGSNFINFSKQLEERNAAFSIIFISKTCDMINSDHSLTVGAIESILECFGKPCVNQLLPMIVIPCCSRLKTGDTYKVNVGQDVVHANPANVHDFHFKIFDETMTANSKPIELNRITIDRKVFQKANVICQLDKKFILVSVLQKSECILYCIDQHAADERLRIESITRDFHHISDFNFTSTQFSLDQLQHLNEIKENIFIEAHILFIVSDHLSFISIPVVLKNAANTLIRCEEILSRYLNNQGFIDCVMPTLTSIACRSAIMFGDVLSISECRLLISHLSQCLNPFVCAHGRPSIVPLTTFKKRKRNYHQ